jgi:hypothetical protein
MGDSNFKAFDQQVRQLPVWQCLRHIAGILFHAEADSRPHRREILMKI